jgi:RNA polymerase primary sigma factor
VFLDVQNGLWTNYNIAIASSASKRKNKRTIVAVLSALKNRGKKKAVAKKSAAKKKPVKKAPAKKVVAKKAPAKKAPAKKAPAKKVAPKKIELKKDLTAKDVQAIVDAKTIAMRQKEVLAELESRGITSINRIPKKVDKDLVDEARALAASSTSCYGEVAQSRTRFAISNA